jgi:hypothetical protein
MTELFAVDVRTVNEHLKNIFKDGELNEDSVTRNFRTTAADGKNYDTKFYVLDAILAVGYRVNSSEATQFRIWATNTLKEFITYNKSHFSQLRSGFYFSIIILLLNVS